MGCGAVSQAREGEEGSRFASWNIWGKEETEGIVEDDRNFDCSLGKQKQTYTNILSHCHVVTVEDDI